MIKFVNLRPGVVEIVDNGWKERGPIVMPPLVEPVHNHTELAERIATVRHWERITGVKTPTQIEQIIQAWEINQ